MDAVTCREQNGIWVEELKACKKDTYHLSVDFSRSLEDDMPQAKKDYPKLPLKKALIALFASEMQDAYDTVCLSGHFQVKKIKIEKQ